MESHYKEKEYEQNVWEIYRKEWETASPEKKTELNKRMNRWQELMKSGMSASQAYIQVMEQESDESPIYVAIEEESDYRVMEEPSGKRPAIASGPRMSKAPLVFLSLTLVAAIIYGFVITGDRNALNTELESVRSILTSTKADLSSAKETLASTQTELASTEVELSSTKETLASTQTELSSTQQTLASAQSELGSTQKILASTKSELDSTQSELGSTKQTLASTQQQLAVAEETLGGLGITLSTSKECSDVALIDNPTATNPTWSQLRTFLSQDWTDKHTYIRDEYDCSQFSRDVHNNAEAAGIRAAEVQISFRNELVGHALNAFLTTDFGLVYVDCTEIDTIARVKVGKVYRAVKLAAVTWYIDAIRSDNWWNSHSEYYYISTGIVGQAVTSSIRIYW